MTDRVLKLLTINHKTAPIGIRERFNLSEGGQTQFRLLLKETYGLQEAFILNTCNRTEIYYAESGNSYAPLFSLPCSFKGIAGGSEFFQELRKMEGREANRHLFRVGVGLEPLCSAPQLS